MADIKQISVGGSTYDIKDAIVRQNLADNYYTKEEVDDAVANADVDLTEYIKQSDLEDYAKKEDLEGIVTEIPEEYVTEEELEAKGYLTEHQDLSEYALKEEIPDVSGFLTEIPEEYVTDSEMSAAIAEAVSGGEISLDGYVTDQSLATTLEEYVTETELNEKGFLTEHQDLSDYALKEDIPNVENFVTDEQVGTKIEEALEEFEVPDAVKVSEEEGNQIVTKDDGIFVGKDIIPITKEVYDALPESDKMNPNVIYNVTDDVSSDEYVTQEFFHDSLVDLIKTKIVNGRSSSNGNYNLELDGDKYVVLSANYVGVRDNTIQILPYLSNSNNWWATCVGINESDVVHRYADTDFTVRVTYIELP